jgi:hypothetical protein
VLIATAGYVLTRDPHCNRGCKTIAQHLLTHGIDGIIAGLFA